jgi:hypothetical protein
MDFIALKLLYDNKDRYIKYLDKKNINQKSLKEHLASTNHPNTLEHATDVSSGGSGLSSIVCSLLSVGLMIYAGFLSWQYTGEFELETKMRIVYTISAANCSLCFIIAYFLFANNTQS